MKISVLVVVGTASAKAFISPNEKVAAIVAALKTDIKMRVKNFFIEYIRTPAGVFSIYIRV